MLARKTGKNFSSSIGTLGAGTQSLPRRWLGILRNGDCIFQKWLLLGPGTDDNPSAQKSDTFMVSHNI